MDTSVEKIAQDNPAFVSYEQALEDSESNAEHNRFRLSTFKKFPEEKFKVVEIPRSDDDELNKLIEQVFGWKLIIVGTKMREGKEKKIALAVTMLTRDQLSTPGVIAARFESFFKVFKYLADTLPDLQIFMLGHYPNFTRNFNMVEFLIAKPVDKSRILADSVNYFTTLAYAGVNNLFRALANIFVRMRETGIRIINPEELENIVNTVLQEVIRKNGKLIISSENDNEA